jgi:hypothetical protein
MAAGTVGGDAVTGPARTDAAELLDEALRELQDLVNARHPVVKR